MSPYPAQVTQEGIVATAWEMVEEQGSIENFPLSRLASALGIQAPSLYRHIKNKADLIHRINEYTLTMMADYTNHTLDSHANDGAELQLLLFAKEFREFAHEHPTTYMLAFSTTDTITPPEDSPQFGNVLKLQNLVAQICGDLHGLTALRGLLAIMHGFVMLELNHQLRRGGDLSKAYEDSVKAYLRGWKIV